mgnify:CR=1 FL=1
MFDFHETVVVVSGLTRKKKMEVLGERKYQVEEQIGEDGGVKLTVDHFPARGITHLLSRMFQIESPIKTLKSTKATKENKFFTNEGLELTPMERGSFVDREYTRVINNFQETYPHVAKLVSWEECLAHITSPKNGISPYTTAIVARFIQKKLFPLQCQLPVATHFTHHTTSQPRQNRRSTKNKASRYTRSHPYHTQHTFATKVDLLCLDLTLGELVLIEIKTGYDNGYKKFRGRIPPALSVIPGIMNTDFHQHILQTFLSWFMTLQTFPSSALKMRAELWKIETTGTLLTFQVDTPTLKNHVSVILGTMINSDKEIKKLALALQDS